MANRTSERGFTLIELMLSLGVLAALGTVAIGSYWSTYHGATLVSATRLFTSDLATARAKAMHGEKGATWGVRARQGAEATYELFFTPTTANDPLATTQEVRTLPNGIVWGDLNPGETKAVTFSYISGSAAETTFLLRGEAASESVSVSSLGSIE